MPYAMFGIIFIASAVYALLLSTRYGRVMTETYTWVTVVFGTAMILAVYYAMSPQPDPVIFWCFVAGGAPIVVRSLVEDVRRELRFRETVTGDHDDANQ
jgi:hypothetical protein